MVKKKKEKQKNIEPEQLSPKYGDASSRILALATIVLVLLTAWYASSTYSMLSVMGQQTDLMQKQLKIMQKDFEISLRPWISIHEINKKNTEDRIAFYYTLINTGRLPATVTFVEIRSHYPSGEESKILYNKITSTVLSPGESFSHQLFYVEKNKVINQAKISLLIQYNSPSQKEDKYETYYVLRNNPQKDESFQIDSSYMK